MRILIFFLFMGVSVIGYSQVSDHVLGTKNGCLDAGNTTGYAAIMSNPSISNEYKDAYSLSWYKCTYEGCYYSSAVRQVLCPYDEVPNSQPPNPRPDPFPPCSGPGCP